MATHKTGLRRPLSYLRSPGTLRGKTLLVISVTILLLLLIISLLLRHVVMSSAAFMEAQDMRTNVGRVIGAINADMQSLQRTAGDYATWDDTYAFVVDLNARYLEQNMNDIVFATNNLNLAIITDVDGNIIFSKTLNLQTNEPIPLAAPLQNLTGNTLVRHTSITSTIDAIVLFPEYAMLIAARPIITSEGTGPIRGTLIMGRALDQAAIARLASTTRITLDLYPANDPAASALWSRLNAYPTVSQQPVIDTSNEEILSGYQVLNGIDGQKSLIVQVRAPRVIRAQSKTSLVYFTLALFAAGGIVIWVMLQVLERVVLARVRLLSATVEEIGVQSDLTTRIPVSGRDEVSHLATMINIMLAALEQAQNHLKRWITELEHRNQEISLLNEMGDLLQASRAAPEAYQIIAQHLKRLFPGSLGGLGLINSQTALIETVVAWDSNGITTDGPIFARDACWALRRGQIHVVSDVATEPVCRHLETPDPRQYLCIPMMAQGEAIGVLHIACDTRLEEEACFVAEAKQQLAVTVTEHIALSLTNLKLRESLHNQAIRDGLTNLFNRRYMEDILERELRRAIRKGSLLGIMMIDVDYFKRINDTFGHVAGDLVLRELAHFLQGAVRSQDVVCRYGGEEFAIILPNAPLDIIKQRAEEIRASVCQLHIQYHQQVLGPLSLSIGLAAFPEHGTTVDALVRGADVALYAAKKGGRDQVQVAKHGVLK